MKAEPARAVADFSRVIELEPGNVEALCNRGAALCDSGRCGPAIRDYDAAIEIDPLSARAHGFKGFALEKLGDFAGAQKLRHPANDSVIRKQVRPPLGNLS